MSTHVNQKKSIVASSAEAFNLAETPLSQEIGKFRPDVEFKEIGCDKNHVRLYMVTLIIKDVLGRFSTSRVIAGFEREAIWMMLYRDVTSATNRVSENRDSLFFKHGF